MGGGLGAACSIQDPVRLWAYTEFPHWMGRRRCTPPCCIARARRALPHIARAARTRPNHQAPPRQLDGRRAGRESSCWSLARAGTYRRGEAWRRASSGVLPHPRMHGAGVPRREAGRLLRVSRHALRWRRAGAKTGRNPRGARLRRRAVELVLCRTSTPRRVWTPLTCGWGEGGLVKGIPVLGGLCEPSRG